MALEWEVFDDASEGDRTQILRVGRSSEAKGMTSTYTGVGDAELAVPDLVCGLAEPAGFGAVGADDDGARHPLQP